MHSRSYRRILEVVLLAAFSGCAQQPSAVSKSESAPTQAPMKESEVWLKRNLQNNDVRQTSTGLQYKVLRTTQNCFPDPKVPVVVHYKGSFTDGSVFDSSYDRGVPGRYPLDKMIAGWTEGIPMMRQGELWEFYIPPKLAYGDKGSPPVVKPDAVLIFQIELVKAERCK